MCAEVELDGKRTNHLLKATTATRLYEQDLPEKKIQERTRHKNVANLRKYQKSDLVHQESSSCSLNPFHPTNNPNKENIAPAMEFTVPNYSIWGPSGVPN